MFRSGDNIGPYTLISRIGRGGFGEVWLAERRTKFVTTKVAVKLPLDELVDYASIEQEAQLWAQASGHQNILPIIEANEYDGQIVIVSEYAPDGSLENWLRQHNGQVPSIDAAMEMVYGILAGLHHLHTRNIIHRDIKPSNILLQGKTPRLADFGIARLFKTISQDSFIAGTPSYMAPEAFEGKRSAQTDIWSVGVILYQLVTGRLPFLGQDIASLFGAIIKADLDPLPNPVSPALQEIIKYSLQKDSAMRFKSAAEMRDALKIIITKSLSSQTTAEEIKLINDAPKSPPISADSKMSLGQITVHMKPSDRFAQYESSTPSSTIMLRHSEAFYYDKQHLFEEFILHKDYERLWRSLVHNGGGRNILTGYGPFGGTSLIQCAIAKARSELKNQGQGEGALLLFYFKVTKETKVAFEIIATRFGLDHLEDSNSINRNPDLNELKGRAKQNSPEALSSVLALSLNTPLGETFFNPGTKSVPPESNKLNYDFSQFVADLNSFFKQRKSTRELRQLVLQLVRSEYLPSRVVLIIDRIKYLETLEALSRSELFSNDRIRVIAIGRKEDFDRWSNAYQRLLTMGFNKWYVPCLWNIDLEAALFDRASGLGLENKRQYTLFLKHLQFKGRGSLGNIISELRQPMNTFYGSSSNFIDVADLANRAEIQHNAWVQEVLEMNWMSILGDLFGGPDQDERTDRARVAIYQVIDYIAHAIRFSREEILKASKKSEIAISDDIQTATSAIDNLLYVLQWNRYLSLEEDSYRVVWDKNKPPKQRKVSLKRFRRRFTSAKNTTIKVLRKQTLQTFISESKASFDNAMYEQKQSENIPVAPSQTNCSLLDPMAESQDCVLPAEKQYPLCQTISEHPVDASLISRTQTFSLTSKADVITQNNEDVVESRNKVFISYSHTDSVWLERLRTHLKPLEREGKINIWDDTKIESGAAWRQEIRKAIDSAKVALLLISASFLASDFIINNELPPLLAAAKHEGTIIIPVIVSPSRFLQTPSLSDFQAVNSVKTPLSMMIWNDQEELFVRITQIIEDALSIT